MYSLNGWDKHKYNIFSQYCERLLTKIHLSHWIIRRQCPLWNKPLGVHLVLIINDQRPLLFNMLTHFTLNLGLWSFRFVKFTNAYWMSLLWQYIFLTNQTWVWKGRKYFKDPSLKAVEIAKWVVKSILFLSKSQ